MTSGVSVLLLGEVEARRRSRPVTIPGLKLQGLLALLALSAPHPVSVDRLIEELWGDHHLSNASNSLHSQIAILRRTLGRDVVVRVGHGYVLTVEPDDVDVLRFERLVARSRQYSREGDHRSAAQGFQTALALVRGPPLRDLVDHPFGQAAAARVEQLVLDAHEGFADAELACGRHADVALRFAELVRTYPLRERFHAQLILALYRCGRQADALRACRDARDVLVEKLGVEPGAELRDLEHAVLTHDPQLVADPDDAGASRAAWASSQEPVVTVAPWSPDQGPLVGRAAELELLRSDLDDAWAGRGRIVLLAGEPGIGKTRLAAELAGHALSRGFVVARGQCHGGRGAPAFWPWTRMVEWLVEHLPSDIVAEALGREAADIGRLVGGVRDLVPDLAPSPALDPEFERFRSCDALSRLLCRLAGRRPLMVVLEDLHWADGPSLELLAYLAGAVVEVPMLIVVSYRSVGPAGQGRLTETLAELARQPVVRQLDVHGIDREAVRQLMAVTGHPVDDALVGAVYRRTQGNPFFLVETLRLRTTTGDGPELTSVPTGVREVVRQRLALLPAATVDALRAASVLGVDFEVAILAATLDCDGDAGLALLEPAFEAAIVVASPEGPGWFQFSHVLVRDTLYEELGAATRPRRHHRAALALESIHGTGDGPYLMALAEHWFQAVPAAPAERGVRAALRAARWAEQLGAHEQVEEQLRAASLLLRSVPDGRRRDELELELHYQASMHLVMTSGYATPGVDHVCARMRELCDSVDDVRLLVPALWRLSIFHLFSDDLDGAVATGQRLIELAGPCHDASPQQLAGDMVLGMVHSHRGELAVGRAHLDRAAHLCRAADDALVAGFVVETPAVWIAMFSAWNWSLLGEEKLAEQGVATAIGLAADVAERTNTYALTFATWVASLVAVGRRDAVETRRRCEEGIAMANARGFGMEFVPFMGASAGWAEAVTDDFDTGIAEIAAAASTVRGSGVRMWDHVVAALLADACVTTGRFGDALSHADEGLERLRAGGARWLEAELHRLRGAALAGLDPSDPAAAEEFGRAVDIAARQGAAGLRRRAEASITRVVD